MNATRTYRGLALGTIAALTLAACGSSDDEGSGSGESSAASGDTVTITDNDGEKEVSVPPQSVVATDNRTFETLDSWDVELSAAAVSLMPDTISYTEDEDVVDLGLHTEPDLEAVVAAEPDLIINGQRYADYASDFEELVPDATLVNLDPREGEPFDEELKRQTSALGTIFEKESEADDLNSALDESIQRVEDAYDDEQTVMAVIVSGGEIGYVVPSTGRTMGPLFDIFGFTPALEVEGSDDHQGDDISVEAIADSEPDIMLVMDRDAAVGPEEGQEYQPAAEVIEESEALQDVPAVQDDKVIYMPDDTYTNESIQTYTEYFNSIADELEQS